MWKNFVRSSIRILLKQKNTVLFSIFSLVIGMTCFILLMLFSRHELGYDSFHKNGRRICMVGQYLPKWSVNGSNLFAMTSGALVPALKREFPEVETAARVRPNDAPLVFRETSVMGRGLFADREFLTMFSYPLIAGDPETALKEPFSAVLSDGLAKRLFGRIDPLGRTVLHEDGREYRVTGILKDPPRNSHLRFDYLLSFVTMSKLRDDVETSWPILNYYSYVLLKDGVSAKAFEAKLGAVIDKYHPPDIKTRRYFLMPLRTLHFDNGVAFSVADQIDRKSVHLLMGIAFLILAVACVNYVNLATARATTRGKEVGVRKTFGADRRQLIRQFIGESTLLALAGLVLSLGLARLLLPVFNRLSGVDLPPGAMIDGTTLAGLLVLGLAVGVLSGCYPAFLLSAFAPANVFRGVSGSRPAPRRLAFRNVLVVIQLLSTFILLAGTAVIHRQMTFIRHKDVGYRRENILALRLWDRDSQANHRAIKADLLKNPDILAAAVSNVAPVRFTEVNNFKVETDSGAMTDLPQVTRYFVDEDYFDLFGMTIVEGRKFSPGFPGDKTDAVILNETAVRMAGLKNPVGRTLADPGHGDRRLRIIGVVKDIHFMSFKSKIGPLAFFCHPEMTSMMFLKISGRNVKDTIAAAGAAIRRHAPNFVFDYAAMDDIYENLYREENKLAGFIAGFSFLAALLSSIGLVGLISFNVERKKKEIAIRKVIGASVPSIVGLILRDLFILIGAAAMASLPLAYSFSRKWLDSYYYRTPLGAGAFLLASGAVFLLALLCVARPALRAAQENPAVSLRNG